MSSNTKSVKSGLKQRTVYLSVETWKLVDQVHSLSKGLGKTELGKTQWLETWLRDALNAELKRLARKLSI